MHGNCFCSIYSERCNQLRQPNLSKCSRKMRESLSVIKQTAVECLALTTLNTLYSKLCVKVRSKLLVKVVFWFPGSLDDVLDCVCSLHSDWNNNWPNSLLVRPCLLWTLQETVCFWCFFLICADLFCVKKWCLLNSPFYRKYLGAQMNSICF